MFRALSSVLQVEFASLFGDVFKLVVSRLHFRILPKLDRMIYLHSKSPPQSASVPQHAPDLQWTKKAVHCRAVP